MIFQNVQLLFSHNILKQQLFAFVMAQQQDDREKIISFQKIIRLELQSLLKESSLRGKIQVNRILVNKQLIILAQIQDYGSSFPTRQEVKIKVLFFQGYPYEAPQIFLQTRLLPHIYQDTNIIDSQQWKRQYNLAQVIGQFIKEIQRDGLKEWLSSRFSDKSNINFWNRHNTKGAYFKQNKQLITPKFGSAFKLFQQDCHKKGELVNKIDEQWSPQGGFNGKVNEEISIEYKNTLPSKKIDKKYRKQTKPMNKNANLPKFLIRIFIKYMDRFKDMYVKKQYDKLMSVCRKMKQWKKNDRRQHAFGLKHLIRFFNINQEGLPSPDTNRRAIAGIISKYLLEQICQNSQIPQTHRVGYLVACKVYALRCRNPSLASRIQSK